MKKIKHVKNIIILSIALILLLSVILCLVVCKNDTREGREMNKTFFNPIRIDSMLGDPFIYRHTDGYYYYMHSQGTGVTVTRSKWMTQVVPKAGDETITKKIFRQSDIGVSMIWAPEMFFIDGYWYCYFTATVGNTDNEIHANRRIYVMKSKTANAMGEWNEAKKMDLPADSWAIDATYMTYKGKHYLLWSGWPVALTSGFDWEQRIYITRLADDDPTRAYSTDPSARIQISLPKYKKWESTGSWMNEGPAVVYAPNGRPFVFYSTSSSTSDFYTMAYCTLLGNNEEEWENNILNPITDSDGSSVGWRKESEPFFEPDIGMNELIAPGHNSFTKSPDGTEDWICYHVAKYSGAGWDRLTRLQKLSWDENNFPKLEYIPHFSEEIPLPSGEQVNRVVYEAEDAILTTGCQIVKSSDFQADGTTVLNFASGGKAVRPVGKSDTITFEFEVPENGEYLLSVRFANTSVNEEEITITVNGDSYKLYAPKTGSDSCYITTPQYVEFFVKPNFKNKVVVSSGASFLIDCIVVDYLDR